jgi:hypothetical protein
VLALLQGGHYTIKKHENALSHTSDCKRKHLPITRCFAMRSALACCVLTALLCLESVHARHSHHHGLHHTPPVYKTYHAESKPRPAIAILITARSGDVEDLKKNLGLLGKAFPHSTADVLLFHEGDVSPELQRELQATLKTGAYKGAAMFVTITLSPPTGCCAFGPNWSKRGKFSYHNMIRFWIKDLWFHPVLDSYDTVMRLDTDSYISQEQSINDPLPGLRPGVVYRANTLLFDSEPVIHGYSEFVNKTIASWPHPPRNPAIVRHIQESLSSANRAPYYNTNFFVGRVDFFRRPDVAELVDRMCCRGPDFFVYRYRWGDHIIQYFLLGMEATPDEFYASPPDGYVHGLG